MAFTASSTCILPPWDFRVSLAELGRQPFDAFTNDDDAVQPCGSSLPFDFKVRLVVATNICDQTHRGLADQFEKVRIRFHKHGVPSRGCDRDAAAESAARSLGGGRLLRHNHRALLHDEDNTFGCGDVGEGVSGNGDHIGELARLERAD
jgi:hypothetical protein